MSRLTCRSWGSWRCKAVCRSATTAEMLLPRMAQFAALNFALAAGLMCTIAAKHSSACTNEHSAHVSALYSSESAGTLISY